MDNNSENIKELFEKIESEGSSDIKSRTDGAIEFKFSAGIPKTALVFEDADEVEAEEEEIKLSPEVEDEPVKVELEIAEPEREVGDEEFEIPEQFFVSDEYNTPLQDDGNMIWKTYVPRFTEATERTYRFIDDKTAASRRATAEIDSKPSASTVAATTVKVRQVAPGEERDSAIAELDSGAESAAVLVNVNGKEQIRTDTINMFKFSEREKEAKPTPTEDEIVIADIHSLIGRVPEPVFEEEQILSEVEVEAEPMAEPVASESEAEEISTDSGLALYNASDYDVFSNKYEYDEEDELPESERPKGANEPISDSADNTEYNSYAARETFKDKFLDKIMSVKLRMIVAAIISVMSVFFESFIRGKIIVGEPLFAPAVIDACFIAALFLIALPETVRAFRALTRGKLLPELSLTLSLVALAVYTAGLIFNPTKIYPLFGFAYSIVAFAAIFATYCLQKVGFSAFKLISEKGIKNVIDVRYTRTLERENIALDGAIDEHKSKIGRMFRAGFVSDFVKNSEKVTSDNKSTGLCIALSVGIATVCAAVMFFLGSDGVISAFSSFALVIMLATPALALITHYLPMLILQSKCEKTDRCFIGEENIAEISCVDVFAFDDVEIFGEDDVTLKSISLSDKQGDFRKAMRQVASLFAALGGPLSNVFSASLNKKYPPAQNVIIDEDGALGNVDGAMIMAGSADYLRRNGIHVPPEPISAVASTKTMYAAENGVLFAKFSIQYSFSEEFALLLPTLRENDIVPIVYTRDPNITNTLMTFLTGNTDAVRIMRKYNRAPAESKVYRALSSGAVTLGDKLDAIDMILLAKKYDNLQSTLSLTELLAVTVGAVAAVAVSVMGGVSGLPTFTLGIWQLAWCAVSTILSFRALGSAKNQNKGNQ